MTANLIQMATFTTYFLLGKIQKTLAFPMLNLYQDSSVYRVIGCFHSCENNIDTR